LIYRSATAKPQRHNAAATRSLLPFATVSGNVLLQAGDGHGHFVRQAAFLLPRESTQAKQITHAVTGLLELAFEPSMLRTANRIGREREHSSTC